MYLLKKICLIAFLLITACQREVPIEGTFDFEGAKIVVNAVLIPTEIITVHISKSASPFASTLTPDYNLPDANVQLYKNDTLVEQMIYIEDGNYTSPTGHLAQPSASYHFEVSHNNLETVETLPEKIPALVSLSNYYTSEEDGKVTIHFGLNDDINTPNTYSINMVGVTPETDRLGVGAGNVISDSGTNCLFLYEEGRVFSDECFLGSTSVQLSVLLSASKEYLLERDADISITLKSLSTSYEAYLSNQNDYYNYVPGFSDPPPLFSNVIGGYGAVISYSEDRVLIEF